jgi:hypothetical protein
MGDQPNTVWVSGQGVSGGRGLARNGCECVLCDVRRVSEKLEWLMTVVGVSARENLGLGRAVNGKRALLHGFDRETQIVEPHSLPISMGGRRGYMVPSECSVLST